MPSPASLIKLAKMIGAKIDDIPINDRLIVQHNVTAEKLAAANKLGGLPVPSLAVSKVGAPLQNFGEVTLVGRPQMAVPSVKNPVYRSDAYTKRKPEIITEVTKQGEKKLAGLLDIDPYQVRELARNISSPSELRYNDALINKFIKEFDLKVPDRKDVRGDYAYEVGKIARGDERFEGFINNFVSTLPQQGIDVTEKIFKGYSPSGDRRYAQATLDNIVKMMQGGAGQEGFNYGLGSIRSLTQPKFNTFEQIQGARNQIVPSAEFETIKAPLNKQFDDVYSMLSQAGRYSATDALMEAAERRNPEVLKRLYPELSPEAYNSASSLLGRLSDPRLPTEYFEVKPQRAVGLNEFAGAILPENASSKTIDILRSGGINDLQFYRDRDEAERIAKFMKFPNQMFGAVPAIPAMGLLSTEEE
jgi:hypothetical protein